MPFLRDEGPPISQATIQKLRESLPVDYGWQSVNETGREVLVVRVPKAKPDYLHDLAEVAFYVGLESVKNAKDVLLIGHEKTARLEPQLLRDHIRAQGREDAGVVDHLRRQLDRQYGHTFVQSPSNHQHTAFAVRIPKETVAQFTPDDVTAIRQLVTSLRARVMDSQYAYVVANSDHERLGRRVLLELIGDVAAPTPSEPPAAAVAPVAAPAAPVPTPIVAAPAPAVAAAPAASAPAFRFPSANPNQPLPPGPTAAPAPQPAPAPIAPVAAAPPAPAAPPAKVPSFVAAAMQSAAAPVAPAEPAPAAEVADHEEYTIVSKPKAPAAPAPVAAPAPTPAVAAAPSAERETHEEYEIVSKPKAPTAPAPAAAPAAEATEPAHEEGKHVLHHDKEFEVFTSKPKPKADTKPSITPPGMGGFQAALAGATAASHAPARTKEYEISGRTSVTSDTGFASKLKAAASAPAPQPAPAFAAAAPPAAPPPMAHVPFPSIAPAAPPVAAPPAAQAPAVAPAPAPQPAPAPMHLPSFTHAPAPAPTTAPAFVAPTPVQPVQAPDIVAPLPPRVAATPTLPVADSGATIVARVAPANPEAVLASRFKEAGYEVVEGLRAQGTVFAFAAHKPNGRRVLVKRSADFAPEDAAALSSLVTALGADVALVVADTVKAGTRLATWGTRIEVVTPADVPGLSF